MRTATFIGLLLLFPCFWYMVAVGGLLPLPVIVMYGFAGGIVLAFSLVHLALYAGIFFYVARRLRRPALAAGVLLAVLALSFAPIYGSGENLASGGKLNRNAYQVYAEAFSLVGNALAQEAPCANPVVPAPGEGLSVVQAEHEWLRKTYGGGALVRQGLGASEDGKRRYDLVVWRKPDGQTVSVCFDVTTVFEETIRKLEKEEGGDPRSPAR